LPRAGRILWGMRAVFIVYLTLIISGIAFYAVIGLTHH
jgi:hypothetical protein